MNQKLYILFGKRISENREPLKTCGRYETSEALLGLWTSSSVFVTRNFALKDIFTQTL